MLANCKRKRADLEMTKHALSLLELGRERTAKKNCRTFDVYNSALKSYERNFPQISNEEIILGIVNSWLLYDTDSELGMQLSLLDLRCILTRIELVFEMMGYESRFEDQLLWPTIIYADKYVRSGGALQAAYLFHLLMCSALIACKFWEDKCIVDEDTVVNFCGISKRQMALWEVNFLKQINYCLILSVSDLLNFRSQHMFSV